MHTLIDRTKHGLTTERDARLVASMTERVNLYEMNLRRIALHGTGGAARLAVHTLLQGEALRPPGKGER